LNEGQRLERRPRKTLTIEDTDSGSRRPDGVFVQKHKPRASAPFKWFCVMVSLFSDPGATKAKAHAVGVGVVRVFLVAGAGFEPAAFRL
jgi:hypothetical protein